MMKRKSFIQKACCDMEIFVYFQWNALPIIFVADTEFNKIGCAMDEVKRKIASELKSMCVCVFVSMNIVIMKWKGFLETITSYDATWKKSILSRYVLIYSTKNIENNTRARKGV